MIHAIPIRRRRETASIFSRAAYVYVRRCRNAGERLVWAFKRNICIDDHVYKDFYCPNSRILNICCGLQVWQLGQAALGSCTVYRGGKRIQRQYSQVFTHSSSSLHHPPWMQQQQECMLRQNKPRLVEQGECCCCCCVRLRNCMTSESVYCVT